MDLATLVGILGAFAIVGAAMALGGNIIIFVNIPSILVVIGGTVFAVLMKFTLGQFLGAFKVAGKSFKFKITSPEELIVEVVEIADAARKGGLLSLEGKEVSNDFLQRGIQLLVDGHDPDVVRALLTKEMKEAASRHEWGSKIWQQIGDVAPAMGMIGTLIGLVQMLSAMDDPKAIGPAMAVALLTTLYGAMIANMVALPFADKLKLRAEEESRVQSMIIDALVAIQSGQNPRVIQTLLKAYLAEGKRVEEE
ncbi:MAG: flagellar motor protein PomA [Pseudomonadales bacterium]|nr:flagellar motor protein PomA [Pseudomonadales bacterium]